MKLYSINYNSFIAFILAENPSLVEKIVYRLFKLSYNKPNYFKAYVISFLIYSLLVPSTRNVVKFII